MSRRDLLILGAGAAIAWPLIARAQQKATPVPRVGVLMGSTPENEAARLGAFRASLDKLGYRDGQTIVIDVRYAEGRPDRITGLASELVATAPAAITCVGRLETAALQAATHTIPIVFMMAPDPVEFGFVASLARPGGNTTGFTQIAAELDGKRLEVLHEVAPTLSRAAFLINPSFLPRVEERFASAEAMAKRLGITLQRVVATRPAELTAAFAAIQETVSEGLLIQNDPMFGTELQRIIDFAAMHRLPTVFEGGLAAKNGGLASYGINGVENARLAAGYIARILNGAKPADLPVQQPTRFELVINLKTAKALGLTVPQSILARADAVIE